jgi:methionyl-tRNA synthetase (EC 6.1.1.10)
MYTPKRPRPEFPKRAVITAGMPYGNKPLHFGHIGGVFIHADTFTRFLKDRIGADNVIFVSGTDCYGSPILASYKKHIEESGEDISMEDYVYRFYNLQTNVLKSYDVQPSLYGASAFGESAKVHNKVSETLFNALYEQETLNVMSSPQFFDPIENVYLNGRQVVGKCPVDGCKSDKAYADECALGHQYMQDELIDPVSILSGEKPVLKDVNNWYFILDAYREHLNDMVTKMRKERHVRPNVINTIEEFLKTPVIYVKRKDHEELISKEIDLGANEIQDDGKKPSVTYVFEALENRDLARVKLDTEGIRYRTGKTLVPFRLSGNIDWGVPVPSREGLDDLTFWVWPESLWAPISFTITYLNSLNQPSSDWSKWWLDKDSKVYQFIGEDNIYFYGVAEMGMLMAYLGIRPDDGRSIEDVNFPQLVANCHLLFLDSKASSSSEVKPPMADELLNHYTKDQLRMHFLSLGLSKKSVSFSPKPFDPNCPEDAPDVVLKDGNLLTNVYNRLLRSCFYTAQKYFDSVVPKVEVREEIKDILHKAIYDYEHNMARQEFHLVIYTIDDVIRSVSKYWSKYMKQADDHDSDELRAQVVVDAIYAAKSILTLLHPITPSTSEFVREYLNLNETLWSWEHIFDDVTAHMDTPETHKLKFIEPKFDFYKKDESQF